MDYLRTEKLRRDDDPLFPATRVAVGSSRHFEAAGLDRKHWRTATPIREIFRKAFERAGLPYFIPNSTCATQVQSAETRRRTPEDFKAWSQRLAHDKVLTTFNSYGTVAVARQRELIRNLANPLRVIIFDEEVADAVIRRLAQRKTTAQL